MADNYQRLRFELRGFGDIKEVKYVYGILKRKKRKRIFYVMNAIEHYENTKNEKNAFRESLSTIRILKVIQSQYKIENRDDIKEILDNTDLERLKEALPDESDSAVEKLTISFQKSDPEHMKVYERFMEMTYSGRISYLLEAVERYVQDGYDIDQTIIEANEFLYNIIVEYRETKDPMYINNLAALIESCKHIHPSSEETERFEAVKSNFSNEVLKLFINDQDLLNYVKGE